MNAEVEQAARQAAVGNVEFLQMLSEAGRFPSEGAWKAVVHKALEFRRDAEAATTAWLDEYWSRSWATMAEDAIQLHDQRELDSVVGDHGWGVFAGRWPRIKRLVMHELDECAKNEERKEREVALDALAAILHATHGPRERDGFTQYITKNAEDFDEASLLSGWWDVHRPGALVTLREWLNAWPWRGRDDASTRARIVAWCKVRTSNRDFVPRAPEPLYQVPGLTNNELAALTTKELAELLHRHGVNDLGQEAFAQCWEYVRALKVARGVGDPMLMLTAHADGARAWLDTPFARKMAEESAATITLNYNSNPIDVTEATKEELARLMRSAEVGVSISYDRRSGVNWKNIGVGVDPVRAAIEALKESDTTDMQPKETATMNKTLETIKQDATDASIRTAGKQLVKLVREPLTAALMRHLAPGDEAFRARLAAFLETEVGTAVLAVVLSAALGALPPALGEIPAVLARELRVRAMADSGDVLADVLMEPLRQVVATYLSAPAPLTVTPLGALPVAQETLTATPETAKVGAK